MIRVINRKNTTIRIIGKSNHIRLIGMLFISNPNIYINSEKAAIQHINRHLEMKSPLTPAALRMGL